MSVYSLARDLWCRLPFRFRMAVDGLGPLREAKKAISSALLNHDDIYGVEYYASLETSVQLSVDTIVTSILRDFAPATLLDVGCGSGALLSGLSKRGVTVTGVDYSEAALRQCRDRGLVVHKFDLETIGEHIIRSSFDMVVSLEVAEHLPARVADRFIDFLVRHSKNIVFTAATPGQGGRDHVNERPHEYWIEKFHSRGFVYQVDHSLRWREEWQRQGVAQWYATNLMLFRCR